MLRQPQVSGFQFTDKWGESGQWAERAGLDYLGLAELAPPPQSRARPVDSRDSAHSTVRQREHRQREHCDLSFDCSVFFVVVII